LVDVSLDHAPAEGRTRYQIARGLSSLGPPAPSFAAAQQAVAIPHSVLVAGVTRDFAKKVLDLLEEHGGRGRTSVAVADTGGTGEAPVGRLPKFVVVSVLLLVAGFGLYGWTRHLSAGEDDEIELPTRAAHLASQGPALNAGDLAARVTKASVTLRCGSSSGSGVLVGKDLVLTSAHALCPPGEPLRAILANGRETAATVGQRDDWLDLALVQVPGAETPPLPLGDATALRTGDHVVSLRTSEGMEATVQEGIVSHQARNLFGIAFLQIDGTPGIGGPLVDSHGRLVGIVSAGLQTADGMGFVLPINYAYSGSRPLLPPPTLPQPDQESWSKLLAQVEAADRKEIQKAGPGSVALLDLASSSSGQGGPVAVVARRTATAPPSETLTFAFRNGQRGLCQVTAQAGDWKSADDAGAQGEGSRYMQWVKKNSLQKDVYLGFAPLDLAGCPLEDLHGAALVLNGADERADRIVIR
jgi:serine protease Do